MKSTLNAFLAFIFLLASVSKSFTQAVNVNDSLALVDLYNSTNGASWSDHMNWLTTAPVSTWHGIQVSSGRVTQINLLVSNLTVSVPSSLGKFIPIANFAVR